jgi:hypothetical protein
LGEKPGYKGDLLPGGVTRTQCRWFLWGAIISLSYTYYAFSSANYHRVPQVWAKEYVLNKEKFRVPDKAEPFTELAE